MSAREGDGSVVVRTGSGGGINPFGTFLIGGIVLLFLLLFGGGEREQDLRDERQQNRQEAQDDFDTMERINRGNASEQEMQQAITESQADVEDLKDRLDSEHRQEIQQQQNEIENSNLPLPQRAMAWLILEQRARELRDKEIDRELQEGGGFLDIPSLNTILAGVGIGIAVTAIAVVVAGASVGVGAILLIGTAVGLTLAALWNAVANNTSDPVANELQQKSQDLKETPDPSEQPTVEAGTNTIFGSLRGAADQTTVDTDSLAVVSQILETQIGFGPTLPLRVDGSAAPDILQPLTRTNTSYIQNNPGEALILALTWTAFTAPNVNSASLLDTATQITQSLGESIANQVAATTVGSQIRPEIEPANLSPTTSATFAVPNMAKHF